MYIKDEAIYKFLKYKIQPLLPALGTLYFALSSIWGFPYGEEIVGTITAINTFLVAVIKVSNINYKKEVEANEYNE